MIRIAQATSAESNPDIEASYDNAADMKTAVLEWRPSAGGLYGSGSRATEYREKQRQDSLQREASKSYSLKDLFKRQEARNIQKMDEAHKVVPLSKIGRGKSTGPTAEDDARSKASDLKRLLELPTEQNKKYGYVLSKTSETYNASSLLVGSTKMGRLSWCQVEGVSANGS